MFTVFQFSFKICHTINKICNKTFWILDQILFKENNLTQPVQKDNKCYWHESDVMDYTRAFQSVGSVPPVGVATALQGIELKK